MNLKNILVSSLAAAALFTGVVSVGGSPVDAAAKHETTAKDTTKPTGIEQADYPLYSDIYLIAKINAQPGDTSATVYMDNGEIEYIFYTRAQNLFKAYSEVHAKVVKIEYANPKGSRFVEAKDLNRYYFRA